KGLVLQILTFSRQAEQELKPVQVNILVREALKLLRASLPTTIDIKQDVKSASLVMGDPTQIHQILMNLCTNAGYAMQGKGGILKVSLENVEIDSDYIVTHPDLKPGTYIVLTVSDTGQGMTPRVLNQIFDPFFTTKGKGGGTGLGLSVVHGIVNSFGGTIYAYSEQGKGSSFKVILPIIERRIEMKKKEEKFVPKGTEHILFIDDEPPLIKMGKQLLESLGYEITTRTSSLEALELFKTKPDKFDLVITDMTMPNMTGDYLTEKLIAIRPDIPVILCTGFSAMITKQKALSMGIRALAMKPILKYEIAQIIRKVLDDM
ncbi:MAG: response regulator, partial [Deltaproteobacteria bacterium]|nr:response regulator [Deltaproteobacteria bacterium]